jgi:hypothetical protein
VALSNKGKSTGEVYLEMTFYSSSSEPKKPNTPMGKNYASLSSVGANAKRRAGMFEPIKNDVNGEGRRSSDLSNLPESLRPHGKGAVGAKTNSELPPPPPDSLIAGGGRRSPNGSLAGQRRRESLPVSDRALFRY